MRTRGETSVNTRRNRQRTGVFEYAASRTQGRRSPRWDATADPRAQRPLQESRTSRTAGEGKRRGRDQQQRHSATSIARGANRPKGSPKGRRRRLQPQATGTRRQEDMTARWQVFLSMYHHKALLSLCCVWSFPLLLWIGRYFFLCACCCVLRCEGAMGRAMGPVVKRAVSSLSSLFLDDHCDTRREGQGTQRAHSERSSVAASLQHGSRAAEFTHSAGMH